MASKVGRLFQDQNLSVHSNGASLVGKGDAKTQKKGGFGGRKPLGDVSNTGKPEFTKASKKSALTNVPQIIADSSNKKSLSKALDKVETRGSRKALSDVSKGFGGRKPLGDVSNTGKPEFTKASKKSALTNVPQIIADSSNKKSLSKALDKVETRGSQKALSDVSNTVKPPVHKKSSVVAPPPCGFEEEGFLHDHQQCIKAMRKSNHMDQMDLFMMIHGPDSSKKLSSPCAASQLSKVEPESPMRYLDLKEMPELSINLDSPPHCKSPLSPNHTKSPWIWEDCDFQVMETPQLLRH